MKNIILIGMPGVGKSTVGVILAKELGKNFADTDLLIQEHYRGLLCELIENHGIEGFLNLEGGFIENLQVNNTVIATGGSVVYKNKAMEHLKNSGKVVYLKISFEELEKRLNNLKGRGVVLKNGQTLRDLYHERIPLYEKYADITVDEAGLSIEETVEKLCRICKMN